MTRKRYIVVGSDLPFNYEIKNEDQASPADLEAYITFDNYWEAYAVKLKCKGKLWSATWDIRFKDSWYTKI